MGPLKVEAVEEPSWIADQAITELSYGGVEPWVVFLRNPAAEIRYLVFVNPDGEIAGHLRLPFPPFEGMFSKPSSFASSPPSD